jgi:16S rRNA A1518/A1519 N6-dimethyltransferase RsmA/KsgA/DIM1 with predicted DNA glycosylase/AP lyase activity
LVLLEGAPFDVLVSNVPFSIVEPLLFKLFVLKFRRAVLLVPSSFAGILTKRESNVGLYASAFLEIERVESFDARHLSPTPDTSLSLIVVSPKKQEQRTSAERLLFELYTQRDKLVGNALREALCRINGWTKRESAKVVSEKVPEAVRKKMVPRLLVDELKMIVDALGPVLVEMGRSEV